MVFTIAFLKEKYEFLTEIVPFRNKAFPSKLRVLEENDHFLISQYFEMKIENFRTKIESLNSEDWEVFPGPRGKRKGSIRKVNIK